MEKWKIIAANGQDITIAGGRIEKMEPTNGGKISKKDILAGECIVLPGFIDVHTHGGCGVDVNHADLEDFQTISEFFATQGVSAWLCSILTDTKEQTMRQIRLARAYIERAKMEQERGGHRRGAELLGIHLEGPCLSIEYKGAMPEHLLMHEADIEIFAEYQELAGGYIKYITLAPEVKNALEIIPKLKELGMVVAMGHSSAGYDIASKAVELGVTSATHLGNAMRLFHQHDPAIWGAALEKDCYVETICDGRHLHPGSVRLYLKSAGWDKVVAITDCIMAAGLADGEYELGVNKIRVVDGDAKLADTGVRAGSTLTMLQALKNICAYTKESPYKVVKLLSENPARLLHLQTKGSLKEGMDADIVILHPDLTLHTMIVGGEVVVYS